MGGESTSRAPPCLSLGHCLYARLPSPRQGKSPGPPYRTRFSNLAARPPAPQIPLPWPRLLELPSGLPRRVDNTPRTPPLLRRQRVCARPAGRAIPPKPPGLTPGLGTCSRCPHRTVKILLLLLPLRRHRLPQGAPAPLPRGVCGNYRHGQME